MSFNELEAAIDRLTAALNGTPTPEKPLTEDTSAVPIRQLVGDMRRYTRGRILTVEAFEHIETLCDKLQWLAKGYGLW